MDNKILAIDIGSSKICAAIAEVYNGEPKIIGYSRQKSQAVKKGVIVNIEVVSQTVHNAISEAKRMPGIQHIDKAIVSISNAYTKSFNSSGVVSVSAGSEITLKEIGRALDTALYNSPIPPEYDVIHVLPYSFKLDSDYIEDPYRMECSRLEVFTHIVAARKTVLQNIKKVVRQAGVEVENIVLSSYASSIATLLPDEKESGVVCIDMGGSTCEMMIHLGNSMRYDYFLGVGSHNITIDISESISTSLATSEEIKVKYADPMKFDESNNGENENLEVPSIGNDSKHLASLETVQKVVHMRIVETLSILSKAIKNSGMEEQISTIVLTGGMTKLKNLKKVAEMFFNKIPIRIAKPIAIESVVNDFQDESNATITGLILYGVGHHTNYEKDSQKQLRHKKNYLPNMADVFGKNDDLSEYPDLGNLGKNDESSQKAGIIEKVETKGNWLDNLKKFALKFF